MTHAATAPPSEFLGLAEFRRSDPPQSTRVDGLDATEFWFREIEKVYLSKGYA